MVRPFGKLRTHHQRILLDFAIVLFAPLGHLSNGVVWCYHCFLR